MLQSFRRHTSIRSLAIALALVSLGSWLTFRAYSHSKSATPVLIQSPAPCTAPSFATTNFDISVPLQSVPAAVAVGDFDGDGEQDLAVARRLDLVILRGNGAGGFSAPLSKFAGLGLTSVAVGDFNGDGKQDLAVAAGSSNAVSILLGDGSGGFAPAMLFAVGGLHPQSVAVGDFNRDGKQDVAIANRDSNDVSILLGNGAGGFSALVNFFAGSAPSSVAVGDFDGDGKQDLA